MAIRKEMGSHTPGTKKRKEIRRCVSMSNSEINANATVSKTSVSVDHHDTPSPALASINDHVSQDLLAKDVTRKRPRIESQLNQQKQQPLDSTASSYSQDVNVDMDSTSHLNGAKKNDKDNETRNDLKISAIQETNSNLESYSHGGHDPNIAYIPCTPIPSSPVRSVVSCDLDTRDAEAMEMHEPECPQNTEQQLHLPLEDVPSSNANIELASNTNFADSSPSVIHSMNAQKVQPLHHTMLQPQASVSTESTSQAQTQYQDLDKEREGITTAIAHLPQELQIHLRALRIETSLAPMKPLLHKLLTHQGYNRRGTFNVPVDPIRFCLKDYLTIIKEPMDLGTIKTRLYSNVFHSHIEVARSIRLVFRNACLYNPPLHPVHEAAKHLLDYFEEGYALILVKNAPINCSPSVPVKGNICTRTATYDDSGATNYLTNASVQTPQLHPQFCALPSPRHQCTACLGRACGLCNSGCLSLEPVLLICAGSSCSGSKIRRNINYYCTRDGSKTWCQKCYPSLPAILPHDEADSNVQDTMYKRDLLKRRNEEDVVERWISCTKCTKGVHEICAFANEFCTDRDNYVCPLCTESTLPLGHDKVKAKKEHSEENGHLVYSFLTGAELPEKIRDISRGSSFDSRALPTCSISDFIKKKVKNRMRALDCPAGAEETLTVRVISDCEKKFDVPNVVLRHFRMQQRSDTDAVQTFQEPPSSVEYRSRAIALFQRIDGVDVCIFSMFIQEYDGADADEQDSLVQKKRVYLAYIDSVEHFRPRRLRTQVYHEILSAYFATARARGFSTVHIWSCPPSRGNSFVFWGHPLSQRTPTKERLLGWYHSVLCHAINRGIITDVKSLYEESFERFDKSRLNGKRSKGQSILPCPPLLEGDFWVEEASRLYSRSIGRWSRYKNASNDKRPVDSYGDFLPNEAFGSIEDSKCPAVQFSIFLENCIMSHPNASPFLRPVNAVALELKDYHDIVQKPMDLSTILTQCLLGEYEEFHEVVADLELVFRNAMRYNPNGHPIHTLANNLLDYVQRQLEILVSYWSSCGVTAVPSENGKEITFTSYLHLSMRLSTFIQKSTAKPIANNFSGDGFSNSCTNAAVYSAEERTRLLFDGPDGIAKLMAGEDTFLLDKKHAHKDSNKKKKKLGKKKESTIDPPKADGVRRESWLSDEVLAAVRRYRAVIFVCHLHPQAQMTSIEKEKNLEFSRYIEGFDLKSDLSPNSCTREHVVKPGVSERNGLVSFSAYFVFETLYQNSPVCTFLQLEFSQYCNLQFDSVRRAKYSTAMLLYYLQNPESPGILPTCSCCRGDITNVRWHKVNKSFDERRRNSQSIAIRMISVDMSRRELCEQCLEATAQKEDYVPIRVTFRRVGLSQ